jgi:hypothetical protein
VKIRQLAIAAIWLLALGSLLLIITWGETWQRVASVVGFFILGMVAMPWMDSKFHQLMRSAAITTPGSAVISGGPIRLSPSLRAALIIDAAEMVHLAVNRGHIDADTLAEQITDHSLETLRTAGVIQQAARSTQGGM